MSPNIHFEVRLLVMGIMAGAGLMALYDLLRLFRALVPHGWFWMGLEDLGYWIFAGLAVFYLLYRENDGSLRLYVISTVFFTMIVYDRLCSTFLQKALKKLKRCFKIGIIKAKRRGGMKKRKNKDRWGNRMAIVGITLVVFSLGIVVNVKSASMKKRDQEYQEREMLLQRLYDQEVSRAEELKEYEVYVQTKQYIEEVAKQKLGLVKPDEILLKPVPKN